MEPHLRAGWLVRLALPQWRLGSRAQEEEAGWVQRWCEGGSWLYGMKKRLLLFLLEG